MEGGVYSGNCVLFFFSLLPYFIVLLLISLFCLGRGALVEYDAFCKIMIWGKLRFILIIKNTQALEICKKEAMQLADIEKENRVHFSSVCSNYYASWESEFGILLKGEQCMHFI